MAYTGLAELIEDALGLAYEIQFLLDDCDMDVTKASLFASELAEVLYKARLLELKIQADEAQDPDPMFNIAPTAV